VRWHSSVGIICIYLTDVGRYYVFFWEMFVLFLCCVYVWGGGTEPKAAYTLDKRSTSEPHLIPLCPLLKSFLNTALFEFFTYFRYWPLISCMVCKYFLPFYWLSPYSVKCFLCCTEAF
jgi:hypothetical protein